MRFSVELGDRTSALGIALATVALFIIRFWTKRKPPKLMEIAVVVLSGVYGLIAAILVDPS